MPVDQLQSTPPLGPGDAVVFSDRALYQTYNFHDPDAVERLAAWLARAEEGDASGVAVVAGRPGSGRDYLVRAAAWLAGERGPRVRHARLSFDGFDPDHHASLTAFADHQLRLRFASAGGDLPPAAHDRKAALLELAGSLPVSYLGAAGIVFLVRTAFSLVDVWALLRSGVPALAGPRPSAEAHLRAILDFATRADRLVLVLPADEIPEPAVQWFVHEPRRNRRLSVVLVTARPPETPQVYGEPLAHVLELRQMTQEALGERVDHRFAPNEFPDRFFSGLWKRTQGVPGQAALAMMDLERGELITRGDGPGAPWRLVVEPDDERLVEYFASHFYDRLNQIRNQRGPMDLHVVRFVELAALCGSMAPPRLIASYMGLTHDERDDLLDRVDQLEDAGRPVFISFDYQHPTFRNEQAEPELVYRFADESNRLIVLRRMIHRGREATGLLQYLVSQVPVITRGNAELFASLAGHLEEGSEEREEYGRRLRWWTDAEEAEAFSGFLSRRLRAGELTVEALWGAAFYREEWPLVRRLAILDALQSDVGLIPLDLLPHCYTLRAYLLLELGFIQEALSSCYLGLQLASDDPELSLTLHSHAYHCCRALDLDEEMLQHAREGYRLASSMNGLRGLGGCMAASRLSLALAGVGRGEEARAYADQALALLPEASTEDELEVSFLLEALGSALGYLADYEKAAECHRKSLEVTRRLKSRAGADAIRYATSLFNLGFVLRRTGRVEEGYQYVQEAAVVARDAAGPHHSVYAMALLQILMYGLESGDGEALARWVPPLRDFLETGPPDVIAWLKEQANLALSRLPWDSEKPVPQEVRAVCEILLQPDAADGVATSTEGDGDPAL